MMTEKKIRGFALVSRVAGDDAYQLPKRMTTHSPAYDFFSPLAATLRPGEKLAIPTGIKAYFPFPEGLFFITRSGNGTKRRVTLANNIALIDSDYYNNPDNEGEIIITLVNDGSEAFTIQQGDRFCQAFFTQLLLADQDNVQDRQRTGGLGSTTNQ